MKEETRRKMREERKQVIRYLRQKLRKIDTLLLDYTEANTGYRAETKAFPNLVAVFPDKEGVAFLHYLRRGKKLTSVEKARLYILRDAGFKIHLFSSKRAVDTALNIILPYEMYLKLYH